MEGAAADFRAELSERLFVLYLGGRWMAPLSDRLIAVPGLPLARLACAEAGDVARARAGLKPARASGAALRAAYAASAPLLRALRAYEAAGDPVAEPEDWTLPFAGPAVLVTATAVPLARVAGLLIAGAGQGLLWKPAPGAAPSAHALMGALGPAAGAGLAMLQGDHATGAALAGQGPVIWVSDAPPPAEMSVSLRVPATDPHRR
ncbi:MAG: hypothetical protein LCH92_06850 [Proteobacteria bacterium]|nr:hypothetical protein [Pseudomonadota bacterium]